MSSKDTGTHEIFAKLQEAMEMANSRGMSLEELLIHAQEVSQEDDPAPSKDDTHTQEVTKEAKVNENEKIEFPGYIRPTREVTFPRGTAVKYNAKKLPYIRKPEFGQKPGQKYTGLMQIVPRAKVTKNGKLKSKLVTTVTGQIDKDEKKRQRRIWSHEVGQCTCTSDFDCIAVRDYENVENAKRSK